MKYQLTITGVAWVATEDGEQLEDALLDFRDAMVSLATDDVTVRLVPLPDQE